MKLTNFKRLATATAITLSVVLTVSAIPTTASAEWYEVYNPGSHVDFHEKEYHYGRVKCRVPHGQKVKVSDAIINRTDDGRFVYVLWMKKLGTMEWHWKDAHNRWCPHWNRSGWASMLRLRAINKPGGHWIN